MRSINGPTLPPTKADLRLLQWIRSWEILGKSAGKKRHAWWILVNFLKTMINIDHVPKNIHLASTSHQTYKKKKSKNSLKARHMPLFGILKGANLVVVFLGFASSGRNKHRPADFPFLLHKLIFMETVWKISINKYLHIQQIHSSSKNLPNIDFPTKKTHLQDLKIKHTLFSLAKSKSHIHSTSFSRILQGFPRHISSRPCRRHVIR